MSKIKDTIEQGHECPRCDAVIKQYEAGQSDKRLFTILETDGCFADGVKVATGCTVGHRTLRIEDYGKIAATFVDVQTEQALRIALQLDVRQRACAQAAGESRQYVAQLQAYRNAPDSELLTVRSVFLNKPIQEVVSRPGLRVPCDACSEDIINEREIFLDGHISCHTALSRRTCPCRARVGRWAARSVMS